MHSGVYRRLSSALTLVNTALEVVGHRQPVIEPGQIVEVRLLLQFLLTPGIGECHRQSITQRRDQPKLRLTHG